MNEVKLIVKESKITDDMIDEEKAYRIGRYMVKHIDYDYNVYGQRIYETLFDKKQFVQDMQRHMHSFADT